MPPKTVEKDSSLNDADTDSKHGEPDVPEDLEEEIEEEEEDEEEGEEDEDEEEERSDAEIAYDFNVMNEKHLKLVMNLLDYFIPGPPCPDAIEAMGKLCLDSPFTTVLCTPDEDEAPDDMEVHGVISLVSINSQNSVALQPIVQQVEALDDRKYFAKMFASGTVGLVINERVVALKEIGAQLFVNMFEEYSQDKEQPKYDHFLFLGRIALDHKGNAEPGGTGEEPPVKKTKKKKGDPITGCISDDDLGEDHFINVEHWACWQNRVKEAPYMTLHHPENLLRGEDGVVAPNSKDEYSIPILVPASRLPQVLTAVKSLDLYFSQQ